MNTTLRIRLLGLIPALLLCHSALWGQLILPSDQVAMEPPVCPKGGGERMVDTEMVRLGGQVVNYSSPMALVKVSLMGTSYKVVTGLGGWFWMDVPAEAIENKRTLELEVTLYPYQEWVRVPTRKLLSEGRKQVRVTFPAPHDLSFICTGLNSAGE